MRVGRTRAELILRYSWQAVAGTACRAAYDLCATMCCADLRRVALPLPLSRSPCRQTSWAPGPWQPSTVSGQAGATVFLCCSLGARAAGLVSAGGCMPSALCAVSTDSGSHASCRCHALPATCHAWNKPLARFAGRQPCCRTTTRLNSRTAHAQHRGGSHGTSPPLPPRLLLPCHVPVHRRQLRVLQPGSAPLRCVPVRGGRTTMGSLAGGAHLMAASAAHSCRVPTNADVPRDERGAAPPLRTRQRQSLTLPPCLPCQVLHQRRRVPDGGAGHCGCLLRPGRGGPGQAGALV